LYQRSLRIREQILGGDHPKVAISLSTLADLYREQGNYGKAEPLYQRALGIQGVPYLGKAQTLTHLADMYHVQGDDTKAKPYYLQAIQTIEQSLEPEHPDLCYPLTGLGNLIRDQGNMDEAMRHYERALHISEQTFGGEHLEVAEVLQNVALLWQI